MSSTLPQLLVLEGQGTSAPSCPNNANVARAQSASGTGNVLLRMCTNALIQEMLSLSPDRLATARLDIEQLQRNPTALVDLSPHTKLHPIFMGVRICFLQLLRYLVHAESEGFLRFPLGVAGFSSGLIAGAVIASSNNIAQYLLYTTEAIRLSFWIGYRAVEACGLSPHEGEAWSLALFGSVRQEVKTVVSRFNDEKAPSLKLCLTAVTTERCITVSGPPDSLKLFEASFLPSTCTVVHPVPIYTLYHSESLKAAAEMASQDIARRNISLPTYTDLLSPLISPVTGAPIAATTCTLAAEIVALILVRPVNFDRVTSGIPAGASILNGGPGSSLARIVAQALSGHVVQLSVAPAAGAEPPLVRTPEPIAIVGMAVNFPGAEDLEELWSILEQGLNTLSEIPSDRFNVSLYTGTSARNGRRMATRFGNFVRDAGVFDNAFFRVSPREARSMSPQQRVLLHTAYHALEDAGYIAHATPSSNPDTFGVYVGVATNDYGLNLRDDVDVYYSTGNLQSFLSGRISYAMGFSGPSIVVDTACSSSLVAIHHACRALQNEDCNAVVAGGVNIMSSPDMYLGLDRAHFLSPTGQCKPWDASADGYARAEGCGMFVLKRLADAVRDNDRVHGIIRGVEMNQSGNAHSITHPHGPTQIALFRGLLAKANVCAEDVDVVEAHGTGTQAGDPLELESIRAVFAPVHVTAVKANIGHAEAASGAASLAKLLLMLRHSVIPATISLKQLNPRIPALAKDGTRIATENEHWPAPAGGSPRKALLNNFGAAGSNCALLLEEAMPKQRYIPFAAVRAVLLCVSCKTEEALEELRERYLAHLREHVHSAEELSDFAYTATARRQAYRFRIAVAAASKSELNERLAIAPITRVAEEHSQKVAFLFSGQGSHYMGMGSGLYRTFTIFREIVDACEETLRSHALPGVRSIIVDDTSGNGESCPQTATFVLECALARLWQSWGVEPCAVGGHSLGEYAALVTAQVMNLEDALLLVSRRALLMARFCVPERTGLLALRIGGMEAASLLSQDDYREFSIACYNGPGQCAVGGPLAGLRGLQSAYLSKGVKAKMLSVPYAYHTSAMEPISAELTDLASKISLLPPVIPVISNVRGSLVAPGDKSVFTSEYFAAHARQPVRFEEGIRDLLVTGDFGHGSACIELGPHPVVLPMVSVENRDIRLIPSLRKGQDDQVLVTALGELFSLGIEFDKKAVYAQIAPAARCASLPAYPFARTRYWVNYSELQTADNHPVSRDSEAHRVLLPIVSLPSALRVLPSDMQGTSIGAEIERGKIAGFLRAHEVGGVPLCPASVLHELVVVTAQLGDATCADPTTFSLHDVAYIAPLVETSDPAAILRIVLVWDSPSQINGRFTVETLTAGKSRVHCSGLIAKLGLNSVTNESRQPFGQSPYSGWSTSHERFSSHTLYEVIFPRVVQYSRDFWTIQSIAINADKSEAYADACIPAAVKDTTFRRIVFEDTLLHAAGFVLNCGAPSGEAFICDRVRGIELVPAAMEHDAFRISCEISYDSGEDGATCDVLALAVNSDTSYPLVLCMMKGIHFKRIQLDVFKRNLLALSRTPPASFHRSSEKAPSASSAGGKSLSSPQTVLAHLIESTLGINVTDAMKDTPLNDLGLDSLTSIELVSQIRTVFALADLDHSSLPDLSLTAVLSSLSHLNDIPGSIVSQPATCHEGTDGHTVRRIVADVLDIPHDRISPEDSLADLGLDSLTSLELLGVLRSRISTTLSSELLEQSGTIKRLEEAIAADIDKSALADVPQLPMLLQSGDPGEIPLFLIHDGGGLVTHYGRLGVVGRTLYGIANPRFLDAAPCEGGVLAMAERYAHAIVRVGEGSPCIVGGWSFGGVLAFETARRLISYGVHVHGVICIDSPSPRSNSWLSDTLIESLFSMRESDNMKQHRVLDRVRTNMKHSTRVLKDYDPSAASSTSAHKPRVALLRSQQDVRFNGLPRDHFLVNREQGRRVIEDWEAFVGEQVPVFDIPGNHFEVFEPQNVLEVTQALIEAARILTHT